MKKIIIGLLTCTLLISLFSSVEAKGKTETVDDLVAQVLKEAKVPGVAISVTTQDEMLFSKGYGREVAGSRALMTENTVSGIGSITKSFTALAILQQVEKGTLKLEDPVIKYLPEFRTFDKEKSDQITIGMLINNATGLAHNTDLSIWGKNDTSTEYSKMLKTFENVTLAFDPGTSFSYSNDGFMLAGMILEKVTGKKYEQIIEDNILNPLSMSHSTTDLNKIDTLGALYGHKALVSSFGPAKESYLGMMLPAGSEFRSSVSDMSHYAQMMLNEGSYKGKTLIDQTTFEKYETKGVVSFELSGLELFYGTGWMHAKNTPYVFHGGQTLSMSAAIVMDTESKIAVSVLYNVSDVSDMKYSPINLAFRILSAFNGKDVSSYQATREPVLKENTKFIEDDLGVLGYYQSETGLMQMEIVNENEKGLICLLSDDQGVSESSLKTLSETKMYAKNVASEQLLGVIRGSNNEVVAIVHPMGGKLTRVRTKPLTGYTTYKGQNYTLQISEKISPQTFSNGEGFKLETGEVKLEFDKTNWTKDFFAVPNDLVVLDQSSIRESVIGGKRCSEQILVYQEAEELMALVQIGIKGKTNYTLVSTMPFSQLTEVRNTQIAQMIESLLII